MKVEILNQYRMIVNLEDESFEEVYRTHKTLDTLKEELNPIDKTVSDDADWVDDGQVTAVYSIVADNPFADIDRVKTFRKHGLNCDFGKRGYHTLDEIKSHDLVSVKGFGIVDESNITEFENEFKVAAQKK